MGEMATYGGNSGQEKFVLDILDYKENGTYVELGAFHSRDGSNTYFLEKDYGWSGVSFEILSDRRAEFIANRNNPCLGDALSFNYVKYFEENNFPKQIDYLQVDIDNGYAQDGRPEGSAYTSFWGLISIPLTQYRFSVITFEHDANMYFKNISIRDMQRELLDSLGYTLVVRKQHEDWWVDPNICRISKFRNFFEIENL
jgi:hypothetical protein